MGSCAQSICRPTYTYQPRQPQETVLHGLVTDHLTELRESFYDHDGQGAGIPKFVEKEFEEFLTCGDPNAGFILFACTTCLRRHALPFSCRGRAICSSCCACRREQATAHLMDHVLPDAAYRQWVCSPPFELVGLLAARSEVLSAMNRIFTQEVFRCLKQKAKALGLNDFRPAAITAIQRFSKTLIVYPHLHMLAADGVFVAGDDDAQEACFHPLPPPSEEELQLIESGVLERMQAFLERKGYLKDEADPSPTALDAWFVQATREPSGLILTKSTPDAAAFSVHAGVAVREHDRPALERLVRYILRPPFADEQLSRTADGHVCFEMRRQAGSGQSSITLEPVRFLRRIAWLIPPPRQKQLRYAGAFAGRAKIRNAVVPEREVNIDPCLLTPYLPGFSPPPAKLKRLGWAKLLARTYDIDSLECGKCGGRLRPIKGVLQRAEIDRILDDLDRCVLYPSQGPPDNQLSLGLRQA